VHIWEVKATYVNFIDYAQSENKKM